MNQRRISLRRISNVTLVLTAAAAVLGGVAGADPVGVALGGTFMLGNFHLIRLLVSRLMTAEPEQGARAWAMVLLTLKLLLSVLLVAAVIYQFPVAPLSFAIGASMLLVAAVLEATLLGQRLDGGVDLETSKS
jgi:hypothetical protein